MSKFFHTTLIVERELEGHDDDFEKPKKTYVKTVPYFINKGLVVSAYAPLRGPGTVVNLSDGKEARIDEDFEDFLYFLNSVSDACCVARFMAGDEHCTLKAKVNG